MQEWNLPQPGFAFSNCALLKKMKEQKNERNWLQ